tara:strand:+ start:672 stop:1949 length:1278 start_codon:yes stop_codon:yes gene_type:complete
MKIYNEVITTFNDITGRWETIYEDSYDYNGPVAFAQGVPVGGTAISAQDTVSDTLKITAGYFTGGDGTLSGTDIHTGSLSNSNEKYYFNITQKHPLSSSAETQFSVAYGDIRGSGSNTYGDSTTNSETLKGETQAIYKQFTSLLMEETEASGGFKISAHAGGSGVHSVGVRDDYVYIWVGKRARFKDRPNKKVWTMALSGRNTVNDTSTTIYLTDDSSNVAAIATPGGPRYNIVSGSLGVLSGSGYTDKTYGWFYPEMGCMVFSGAELSASLPGPNNPDATITLNTTAITASYNASDANIRYSSSGFAPNTNAQGNPKNALRFVNCMRNMGSSNTLRLRSEEDQTQENYFCRINAQSYNFSANPTFVSGALNKLRHTNMHGNPQTFITGVGLYNSAGQLLATARLSSPLKKNFASEATIKVKLTY